MKKNNDFFCEWLKSIPFGEYTEKTQQLANYCGVSKVVISFWKSGRTAIKPAYQRLIEDFAGKKIFN
ncbi:MAG: hypothetical protein LBF69_00955 [Prevotellaceae bacterium]|jgi:hypothetical protein|nr:hypothetical protein [Prevotellaceae bacterium]